MGAFYTLALAIVPKFVQHLVHHDEGRLADTPALRVTETRPAAHAHRHRALSCHWERAEDGSLVAHWVPDEEEPSRHARPGCIRSLLQEIPRELIDTAFDFERHGSTHALIAVSRMARMNQSRHVRSFTRNPKE
jgi:hypothetical protein